MVSMLALLSPLATLTLRTSHCPSQLEAQSEFLGTKAMCAQADDCPAWTLRSSLAQGLDTVLTHSRPRKLTLVCPSFSIY